MRRANESDENIIEAYLRLSEVSEFELVSRKLHNRERGDLVIRPVGIGIM